MKITFTRGTSLGGIGNDAHPGDVLDLPDAKAADLIRRGRAVAFETVKDDRKPNRSRQVASAADSTDKERN